MLHHSDRFKRVACLAEVDLHVHYYLGFGSFLHCFVFLHFRVTRKYLKCLWKTMEKTCSKNAAEWQYKTHRAMIQPTMDFADCDLGMIIFYGYQI